MTGIRLESRFRRALRLSAVAAVFLAVPMAAATEPGGTDEPAANAAGNTGNIGGLPSGGGAGTFPGVDGADDDDPGEDALFTRDAVETAAAATADSGGWQENATRVYHDSVLHLAWQREMGDRGDTLLGQAEVVDSNIVQTIRIPVTAANNFFLVTDGRGSATYASREGVAEQRPSLVVNGTTRYPATRDTYLTPSSLSPQGAGATLKDNDAILVAFDGYQPRAGDQVVLELTSIAQYTTHTIEAYAPNIHYVYPEIPSRSDATVVAAFTATSFRPKPNITVANGIATGYLEATTLSAFSELFVLPPGDEYYMTSVVKLHGDWPTGRAGKLPGLSNTGQATNTAGLRPCVLADGTRLPNAGWGGRPANGCRWSARAGWSGRNGDRVGVATYFYAHAPKNGNYGVMNYWPTPITVDRWFAYVQRVKINTPGEGDGQLSYWLCTEAGCLPQFHRADIAWRAHSGDQTKITELWANIYCGGTNCGTAPWPRSTASVKRLTVTRGLPDMTALAAEVRAMNP